MVMPYRQQGSLATWVRQYPKAGILSLQEAAHFLRSAAEALQYAHEHDIIHRGVKPSNFTNFTNQVQMDIIKCEANPKSPTRVAPTQESPTVGKATAT